LRRWYGVVLELIRSEIGMRVVLNQSEPSWRNRCFMISSTKIPLSATNKQAAGKRTGVYDAWSSKLRQQREPQEPDEEDKFYVDVLTVTIESVVFGMAGPDWLRNKPCIGGYHIDCDGVIVSRD